MYFNIMLVLSGLLEDGILILMVKHQWHCIAGSKVMQSFHGFNVSGLYQFG